MRGGIDQHLLAREGWWIVVVLALLTFTGYIYLPSWLALSFLLLLLIASFILRNPIINIPAIPVAVVSPANGRLVSVEKTFDPRLSREAIRMQISTGILDVHSVRSPVEGKIMNEWSSDCDVPAFNRRYSYWFQTDEGDDVVVSLLLGKRSPFTRMFIRSGERIGQGEYGGYLYFAGMVEIFMPANARIEANPGDRVRAGVDILGVFVHEEGVTGVK